MHPDLLALAESFAPRVEQVSDRVFVAIGYGLANTVVIVGDDGLIVVDVLESIDAAASARDALLARIGRDLPVKAIVYTHGHPDHVWGGPAWVPPGTTGVEVLAHETVSHFVNEFTNVLAPRYVLGALHMYGSLLEMDPTGFVVNGIGPRLNAGHGRGFLAPTRTFTERDEVEIAGVRLELEFAPGESPDQIYVWLPDDDVVISGDTIYRSFPNLYTIRGARFRDPRDWYGSVDAIRARHADHVVPCHGGPLHGRDEIHATLTAYRDAIQFVFDQTIRGMNAGRSPIEIAHAVELPPHLAEHPFLRQLYGQVDLCVREIFVGLYGWFGGNSAELVPLTEAEESAEIVALAGGVNAAVYAVRAAVADGRLPWAVRIGTHVLRVDPDRRDVQDLVANALEQLAFETPNANLRNWYLTDARVVRGTLPLDAALAGNVARSQARGVADGVAALAIVSSWPVRLDPLAARTVEQRVRVTIPDEHGGPAEVIVALRRGVCAIEPSEPATRTAPFDLLVTLPRAALLALHCGDLAWSEAGAEVVDASGADATAAWVELTHLFDGW